MNMVRSTKMPKLFAPLMMLVLSVKRDVYSGLIGPNGAGKTTTLRIISTMLKPSHGSVTVVGYDTLKQPQEVRRHIGFMTAQTALYDRLTPTEMVQYIADLYGMEMNHFEERREKIFQCLICKTFQTEGSPASVQA